MPYQLDTIEQNAIETILGILNSLKNKHANNTIKFIPISMLETIVYTLICYSKINENIIENICSDLNIFLSANILIPKEKERISKLLNSFKVLNEKSSNSIRACWVTKTLKEYIYSKELLSNTNYTQQIITQTIAKIGSVINQLNEQKNILYKCSHQRFTEENYQYTIQQYHNLNKKLDILNEELLHKSKLLVPKIEGMHAIYKQIIHGHKSVEIIDNLTLCNEHILNVYINNIIKQNYSIKEIKCYINQQKSETMNLHYELPKYNSNPNYNVLAKDKLIVFNGYYTQCEIALDIDELNINLQTTKETLVNYRYKCLNQANHENLTNKFQKLFSKTKILNPTIYGALALKIEQLKQNHENICNIYKTRSSQYVLLTSEQEYFVNLYFQYNPKINKLSKKTECIDFNYQKKSVIDFVKKHNNILPLMYSVIKEPETNKLFVILPSKTSTIILRNASEKSVAGLIGKGTYGKVKLVQTLHDYSIIVVKIQKGSNTNLIKETEVDNEEKIQKMLGQFVASSRTCADKINKYYIFSKYIEGEKLLDYFNKNPDLTIEEITTIIIKILHRINFLHNTMNIIHGDPSFSNILYDPKKKSLEIIDFGFSGVADENGMINFPEIIDNHRSYIAKECYLIKKATFASDIYCLGWWIKFHFKNKKFCNNQKTSPAFTLRFTNFLDKMLDNNYSFRPKITDCIQEFESLLDGAKKSQPKLNLS